MVKRESKKLENLFRDTLKDIYFAEKKILATLPKMEKAAQSAELKGAFAKHRKETEGHVARLEEVFAAIDKRPQGKTCDAILGITDEGAEIMKEYKRLWMPACSRQPKRSSTMKSRAMAHSKRGQASLD
jgi:ferritin-like metal-binding protein YciE